jgi:hypothetical protein
MTPKSTKRVPTTYLPDTTILAQPPKKRSLRVVSIEDLLDVLVSYA